MKCKIICGVLVLFAILASVSSARAEMDVDPTIYGEIDGYVDYDLLSYNSQDFRDWKGERYVVSIYPEIRQLERIETRFRFTGSCIGFYLYTPYLEVRKYSPLDISSEFEEVAPGIWEGVYILDNQHYNAIHLSLLLVEVETNQPLGIETYCASCTYEVYLPLVFGN